MACIADTNSIDLTIATGVLSADLKVDPGTGLPPNPLVVNAAGIYVRGADGWLPLPATLAFSSASAPTFVATISADVTSFVSPGAKIKLTQSATVLYFEVVAITASTVTLYGGDQYVLANSAISAPSFSLMTKPALFPALTVSSTLPQTAYDGMEVNAVIDATNGYVWKFRYRAASSTKKWEFVGGATIRVAVDTDESVATTAYVDLATVGPTFTIPFTGDYNISYNHRGGATNPVQNYASIKIGAAAASDNDGIAGFVVNPTDQRGTKELPKRACSAGDVVKMVYRSRDGNPSSFQFRVLSITPVRAS